uniref:Uncharacterized protein n=1 Tax=Glossina palpalis gambiensis TaxID=67801 RepID=A0A1B0AMV4_9MUSC
MKTALVSHVKIDSPVFRLHTNATVILLITFSIAVTTRQYVGNPIDCQGSEVPFPGVHNSQGRGPLTIKHTKYYQWVAFTLFFQKKENYTNRLNIL